MKTEEIGRPRLWTVVVGSQVPAHIAIMKD